MNQARPMKSLPFTPLLLVACVAPHGGDEVDDASWPQFRGPGGLSISSADELPELGPEGDLLWDCLLYTSPSPRD